MNVTFLGAAIRDVPTLMIATLHQQQNTLRDSLIADQRTMLPPHYKDMLQ